MASARVEAPSSEMALQALRGQLATGGMTGPALDDSLELVQKVGDEPAYATRLRQVLTQPTGLAQAMLAAAPRVASAWVIVGLMALTALAGPLLAYAIFESSSQTATAIGDPFQVYATHLPGWAGLASGVVGAALLLAFLLLVARYQRPTLLGLFGGLAGGIVVILGGGAAVGGHCRGEDDLRGWLRLHRSGGRSRTNRPCRRALFRHSVCAGGDGCLGHAGAVAPAAAHAGRDS